MCYRVCRLRRDLDGVKSAPAPPLLDDLALQYARIKKTKTRRLPGRHTALATQLLLRIAFISFLRAPFFQCLARFFLGVLILSSTHKRLAYF